MPRKPAAPRLPRLEVTSLGPIKRASVEFGDLTVFVGPQASGKSILLQCLKLAIDHEAIASELRLHGLYWHDDEAAFLDLYFGEGMRGLQNAKTEVRWNGRKFKLERPMKRGAAAFDEKMFYIPAHRALTLRNGWPRHFGDYSPGDPFVVRAFSEDLRRQMEYGLFGETLFPHPALTTTLQRMLQRGIYGDYKLRLDRSAAQKRLVLRHGRDRPLPFMVWSAGQREFSPLLLGLYLHIEESRGVDWIVLEEPEMGLHPRAITAVLFLVLQLIRRGHRVCISTHSPHILDLVWALRVFIEQGAEPEHVLALFDVRKDSESRAIAESVLKSVIRVYSFDRQSGEVSDISRLDPDSPRPAEVTWGGLIEFSAHVSNVVADFIANK